MCWQVYIYNILVAQVLHREYAQDFYTYNHDCTFVFTEVNPDVKLHTTRLSTNEIDWLLRKALAEDWL